MTRFESFARSYLEGHDVSTAIAHARAATDVAHQKDRPSIPLIGGRKKERPAIPLVGGVKTMLGRGLGKVLGRMRPGSTRRVVVDVPGLRDIPDPGCIQARLPRGRRATRSELLAAWERCRGG